jgi:hypothetical protein
MYASVPFIHVKVFAPDARDFADLASFASKFVHAFESRASLPGAFCRPPSGVDAIPGYHRP